MTTRGEDTQSPQAIDRHSCEVLSHFPTVTFAMLFGSVALGRQRVDSDLDLAVAAQPTLTVQDKMALIGALAERTGS